MSTLHCVKPYTHWVLWNFSVFCAICSMLRSKCVDPPKDMTISRSWRSSTSQKPWQLDMAYLHSEVDSDAIFNYNCHATSHAENCRQIFVVRCGTVLDTALVPCLHARLAKLDLLQSSSVKFRKWILPQWIAEVWIASLCTGIYMYLHVLTTICPLQNCIWLDTLGAW